MIPDYETGGAEGMLLRAVGGCSLSACRLRLRREPGRIYFMQIVCGDAMGPIKIGFSTDVAERIRHFQTALPWPVTLLGKRFGGVRHERSLHERFAPHRMRGEWFFPADAILAEAGRCACGSRCVGPAIDRGDL